MKRIFHYKKELSITEYTREVPLTAVQSFQMLIEVVILIRNHAASLIEETAISLRSKKQTHVALILNLKLAL